MVDGCLSLQMPRIFPEQETLFIDFDISTLQYPVENVQDYCIACFSAGIQDLWYRNYTCLTLSVPDETQTRPCDFAIDPSYFAQRISGGYAKTLAMLYPNFNTCVCGCLLFLIRINALVIPHLVIPQESESDDASQMN